MPLQPLHFYPRYPQGGTPPESGEKENEEPLLNSLIRIPTPLELPDIDDLPGMVGIMSPNVRNVRSPLGQLSIAGSLNHMLDLRQHGVELSHNSRPVGSVELVEVSVLSPGIGAPFSPLNFASCSEFQNSR